jgi:hypothetical protein
MITKSSSHYVKIKTNLKAGGLSRGGGEYRSRLR